MATNAFDKLFRLRQVIISYGRLLPLFYKLTRKPKTNLKHVGKCVIFCSEHLNVRNI